MLAWVSAHTEALVGLWCLVGALLGLVTLGLTLRRRQVPSGLFSALLAFCVAELLVMPPSSFSTPALQLVRFLTVFLTVDVLLLSFFLRRQWRTIG